MSYDYLVFDLDGTLSDPKAGVVRSTNYALAEFGYDPVDAARMDAYIGPPLDFTFRQITGSEDGSHIQALKTGTVNSMPGRGIPRTPCTLAYWSCLKHYPKRM